MRKMLLAGLAAALLIASGCSKESRQNRSRTQGRRQRRSCFPAAAKRPHLASKARDAGARAQHPAERAARVGRGPHRARLHPVRRARRAHSGAARRQRAQRPGAGRSRLSGVRPGAGRSAPRRNRCRARGENLQRTERARRATASRRARTCRSRKPSTRARARSSSARAGASGFTAAAQRESTRLFPWRARSRASSSRKTSIRVRSCGRTR